VAGSHGSAFAEGWVDSIDLGSGAFTHFGADTGFAVLDLAQGVDGLLAAKPGEPRSLVDNNYVVW